MLVVDASILAPVVADAGADGRRYRQRLRGEAVVGPDLLRVEVTSVIRRHLQSGRLTPEEADVAIANLLELPITVYPTAPLLPRAWELRHDLSAYDGCYVALAEATHAVLLTADRRMAGAPRIGCPVEVP